MRYELSDFEWAAIKPFLPNYSRGVAVNDRRVFNGIFWVPRTMARYLPVCYGPRTTCYNRFVRWRKAGILFQCLSVFFSISCANNSIISPSAWI